MTSIIQIHGDINEAFDVGSTFVLNRWAIDIIYNSVKIPLDSIIIISEFMGAGCSYFSLTGVFLCRTFGIKSIIGLIAIGTMIVTVASIIIGVGYNPRLECVTTVNQSIIDFYDFLSR